MSSLTSWGEEHWEWNSGIGFTCGQDVQPAPAREADLCAVIGAVNRDWEINNGVDLDASDGEAGVESAPEAVPARSLMLRCAELMQQGEWQLQHIKAKLGLQSTSWTQACRATES